MSDVSLPAKKGGFPTKLVAVAVALLLLVAAVVAYFVYSSSTPKPTGSTVHTQPTTVPTSAPTAAPLTAEQILSKSEGAMKGVGFTVNRTVVRHSDGVTVKSTSDLKAGANFPILMAAYNTPTYQMDTITDADKCPGATCWKIHVAGTPDANGNWQEQDTWINQATNLWLSRYRFDHLKAPGGASGPDLSIETTEKVSFN